jgi:energy-coupling factor transporter ATP-binding protein EcfA2
LDIRFKKEINMISLLLALALQTPSQAHAAEICGQLAGVRGTGVEILRMQRGRSENVRYAMKIAEKSVTPIECDDVVLAGKESSARILLADAKLSLGGESRIEIAAHTGAGKSAQAPSHASLINLTYGKLRALVNRKKDDATGETKVIPSGTSAPAAKGAKGQITFEIKTFSAVAGVRGTDFFVSYDPNAGTTSQATIEGSVEVAQAGTTQKVLVDAGKEVAVETTASAVRQAQERLKSADLPKVLPDANEPVKPLKVVALSESTKMDLRQTSAAVSDDRDFTSKKAIETIGQPSTWTIKRETVPDALKKIKNEY